MEKFQNKYRISSARAYWWDYGSNAAYFFTICTQNRLHYFGEIENNEMIFSPLGMAAQTCWKQIPDHFPFVQLGAFVVMPNHVHGIIIINKLVDIPVGTQIVGTQSVETQNFASLPITTKQKSQPSNNQFGPQSKNLGSIIRGFKIGVTKQSKIIAPDFKWQSRYHDHIIRNEAEYHRIEEYILKNPINWKNDKFNKSVKFS
ncbi:MAG: hypothetical protein WBJ84_07635 [Bacteroidales bacterium]